MPNARRSTKRKRASRVKVATRLSDAAVNALARLLVAAPGEPLERALNDVVMPYLNNPIGELEPIARMFRVLFILRVEVSVHGIERFFWSWPNGFDGGDEGAYAEEAAGFCDRIGAPRAAAYLRDAIRLFPGERVPREFRVRSAALDSFNTKANGYPLTAIDAKYEGAVGEMLVALQRYAVENQKAVEAALRGEGAVAERRAQLDAVLLEPDDWQFLDRMLAWGHEVTGIQTVGELDEKPRALRELLLVRIFAMDVQSGGGWKFLEHLESPPHLRELVTICDRIGANSAAAYLRAMRAAFPRGRIPTDPERREELLDAMSKRGRDDPLRALDKQYQGATEEMVAAYRRHIAADPAGYEQRMNA